MILQRVATMRISSTEYDWEQDSYYRSFHLRLRIMEEPIALLKPLRVLDVGCGSAQLAALLPEGIQYFGIDACASPNLPNFQKWVFDENLPTFPFTPLTFDMIVFWVS